MLLCVGLDQKTADAGVKEVLSFFEKNDIVPMQTFDGFKAVVTKEYMLDQTLMDILEEKKPFSLGNLFKKNSFEDSPPLEDLGVPVVIIAGISPKFIGALTKNFRFGI